MVNKLWYKQDEKGELYNTTNHQSRLNDRKYIQKFINLYCHNIFKFPEDITPDNLSLFIKSIIYQYQYYNISIEMFVCIGESASRYIREAYIEEFPDGLEFPDDDKRTLAECILSNCMEWGYQWFVFPEDMPFILKCLESSDSEIPYIYNKLDE